MPQIKRSPCLPDLGAAAAGGELKPNLKPEHEETVEEEKSNVTTEFDLPPLDEPVYEAVTPTVQNRKVIDKVNACDYHWGIGNSQEDARVQPYQKNRLYTRTCRRVPSSHRNTAYSLKFNKRRLLLLERGADAGPI